MSNAWGWLGTIAFGVVACAAAPSPSVAPGPVATLAGTRWMGVIEDKSADPRTLPRLEFVREGRLAGFTGCNMLSGVWKMEAGEVRIGALVTTKRLCIGPEGETEKRFLAALSGGSRGRREGGQLVFTGPRGERFAFAEAAAT